MAQLMPRPVPRQAEKETLSAPPGKAVFKAILSEDIDWKSFPARDVIHEYLTTGTDSRAQKVA